MCISESIQRTFFAHYLAFHELNPGSRLLNSSVNVLKYLVSPCDTTENTGERQPQTAKQDRSNILGLIKTLLWIAVSITLSLVVGQLS